MATSANEGSDLRPGAKVRAGVYVVSHREPAHAQPHQVLIAVPMVLPGCRECNDVRFSFKERLPTPLQEHEFFKVAG
jgi:hypothetical protein